VSYQWIRFLHIASGIGFVALHGTSIAVLHANRNEASRTRLEAALDFSGRTTTAMYGSLVAVVGTGLWMGLDRTALFRESWYWLSLGLLAATGIAMWFVAKPFTTRLRSACEIRPSGVPRVSDAELRQILRSWRPNVIAAIGAIGLVGILYLMVFQPVVIGGGVSGDAVSDLVEQGEELFQRTAGGVGCAACHGTDAEGRANAPSIVGVPKTDISRALAGGVEQMSGIELDETELEAVYQYLQTLP
jgi:cytochrome c553